MGHIIAKCVAWGTCGEGFRGSEVSMALGSCAQSAFCHGAGHVDTSAAKSREGMSLKLYLNCM